MFLLVRFVRSIRTVRALCRRRHQHRLYVYVIRALNALDKQDFYNSGSMLHRIHSTLDRPASSSLRHFIVFLSLFRFFYSFLARFSSP